MRITTLDLVMVIVIIVMAVVVSLVLDFTIGSRDRIAKADRKFARRNKVK